MLEKITRTKTGYIVEVLVPATKRRKKLTARAKAVAWLARLYRLPDTRI